MRGTLNRAFGYQDNNMALPVADLAAAVPFYESALGFRVMSRADSPVRAVVLGRDDVQIGLAENGGDASQDGCAFHVTSLDALFEEFKSKGLALSDVEVEQHDDADWRVFYVVAPDGLCYWFGEQQVRA